jgi:ZIP family zinc transporter
VTLNGTAIWLRSAWRHATSHPFSAMGLAIPLFATVGLLLQSIISVSLGHPIESLKLAVVAGLGGFVATTVGAIPALVLKGVPQKIEDTMLGFAAGMMLAASAFSLIIPGIEVGQAMTEGRFSGVALVAVGLVLGSFLMLGLEQFTPHEHRHAGGFGVGSKDLKTPWLFVFAIALHNLPEGMAMGVSFSRADWSIGLPISSAIAIQDIPEGLAVALTLRASNASPLKAFLIASATGLLEPLGAIVGVTLASGTQFAYPIGLGLAAGAMIFVVSHEVIPETHRNGHQTPSTMGLMLGFLLMMILDTAMG